MTCPKGSATNELPQNSRPLVRRALETDAIHRGHIDAVGDGVCALDGSPGIVLGRAVFCLLRRMPADRRRIEKNARALQRGQPRCPPDTTDPSTPARRRAVPGIEVAEAQVSRCEVEFLVDRADRPGCASCGTCPIVDRRHRSLPQCCDKPRLPVSRKGRPQSPLSYPLRHSAEPLSMVPEWFRQIEQLCVLLAAEVLRPKEFLKANYFCAFFSSFSNTVHCLSKVFIHVGRATHLHKAYLERRIATHTGSRAAMRWLIHAPIVPYRCIETTCRLVGQKDGGVTWRRLSGRVLSVLASFLFP